MQEHTLWLENPALTFRESTPIGNGRLGAMLFGGVTEERIVLNESSLWSGSPEDANWPDAHQSLPEIRRLLLEGKNDEAEALVMEKFICKGPGSGEGRGANVPFGCYQVLGNLHLSLHQNNPGERNMTGVFPVKRPHYQRELDLARAVMRMEYDLGGIRFRREAFASAPAEAIVMRFSADQPGQIFFRARLDRAECFQTTASGSDALLMTGQLENGVNGQGVKYACRLRAVTQGGRVTTNGGVLEVAGADEALLFITAATNAHTFGGRNCADELSASSGDLATAGAQSWEALLAAHTDDYQHYYNRSALELGPPNARAAVRSTPARIQAVQAGEEDPGLAALFYNFGRYLLISSSRPGGLPANLQGIWAEEIQTPWNGDWHLNAQQMNYWPAEVCNLAELHGPIPPDDCFFASAREENRAGVLPCPRLGSTYDHEPVGLYCPWRECQLGLQRAWLSLAVPAPLGTLLIFRRPGLPGMGLSHPQRRRAVLSRYAR